MSDQKRKILHETIISLQQQRDELALKIHLGSLELKDEWEALGEKLSDLIRDYEPFTHAVAETSDEVWEALKLTGEEIRRGFNRIRKSM
ncbi:MAG: hypothetical protein JKY95_11670 [Planctomycetaceae bacterium]|nr:hypothetical protein [Planctomycetaceae bacterium]